jgi:hypothetical protein
VHLGAKAKNLHRPHPGNPRAAPLKYLVPSLISLIRRRLGNPKSNRRAKNQRREKEWKEKEKGGDQRRHPGSKHLCRLHSEATPESQTLFVKEKMDGRGREKGEDEERKPGEAARGGARSCHACSRSEEEEGVGRGEEPEVVAPAGTPAKS